MYIEEFVMLDCEEGHKFFIPSNQLVNEDDEEIGLENIQCPICGEMVATEASRTALIAVTGKDTLELWDYDEKKEERIMESINNYDPNYSDGIHEVEATLQVWDYRKTLTYEMGGNCKGLTILESCTDDILEQLGFYENDDEDEYGCIIYLVNDDGDKLEYEIYDESDLENIIVGLKIVGFIEKEED